MFRDLRTTVLVPLAVLGLAGFLGSLATAEPSGENQPTADGEMQLPPGWTAEDMQAMIAAGTPGEMHEVLMEGVGVWRGRNESWMVPGGEPIVTESVTTVTPIMDGRYIQVTTKGEMPGMGAYHGMGIYGYDNASQQFVGTWIDNRSTGMMDGAGELSDDGKTLTWTFDYHCPITDGPVTFREIETVTGPDTKMLELYGADPKTGEVHRMMRVEMTRISEDAGAS